MSSKIPRLAYGFLSASVDPINIKLPWQFSNQDGMFKMNYIPEDGMKEGLKFWALCNKGEYIMDAEFGLDLKRFLFLPAQLLKENVLLNAKQQLPKYFPKFKQSSILILTSDDNTEIKENNVIFTLEGSLIFDKKQNLAP